MAESTPRKFQRGDDVREASTPAAANQLLWDGFTELEAGAKPKASSTPRKTAARAQKSTSARGKAAASGDSASGEKTVGTNPA